MILNRSQILDTLRGFPRFSDMSLEESEALVDSSLYREFAADRLLIKAGDVDTSLSILLRGRVRVFLLDPRGKELTLTTPGPGDVFGELALLLSKRRAAHVVSCTEVTTLVLPQAQYREHTKRFTGLTTILATLLAERVAQSTEKMTGLAFSDVTSRLTSALREMGTSSVVGDRACRVIVARPTHQELADLIGTSREVVSRELKELSETGIVRLEGKRLILWD